MSSGRQGELCDAENLPHVAIMSLRSLFFFSKVSFDGVCCARACTTMKHVTRRRAISKREKPTGKTVFLSSDNFATDDGGKRRRQHGCMSCMFVMWHMRTRIVATRFGANLSC